MDKSCEIELKVRGAVLRGVIYNPQAERTVVALHGWLDNAASFACLSKHFSTCRVIALEFFGHGHSDHRPAGAVYYLWENVLDLHCALEALDLGMVTLVGHSMGASVAMLYAASFAQRVERLCLIEGLAPLHYCESELPALMANAMKRHLRKRRVTYYDTLDTLIAARAKSKFSLSQEAASALVKRGARVASQGVCWRSDPALLNPSVQRFSKAQVMHFLAAVNVPVLLILGDEGIETTHWQAYYTQLTQLEVHRLKGNHHLHMYSKSAVSIASIMSEFFERTSSLELVEHKN